MAKPFSEHSGSSQHLHISLWRDGAPAFASDDGAENDVALRAIAGLLEHLPSITLFGAHSVNAYRRFVPDSFAPATVTWSRDNRSAAVRSLIEADPAATRIELRSGASDANPYWLVASATGGGGRRTGGRASAAEVRRRATCTSRARRCPSRWALRSPWPPRTTRSSTSSVRSPCTTSRPSRAASGSSIRTTSATGNANAIWPVHDHTTVRRLGTRLRKPRRPQPSGRRAGRRIPPQPRPSGPRRAGGISTRPCWRSTSFIPAMSRTTCSRLGRR